MKYFISLFLMGLFSLNTFSQGILHSDYEKDSKWFIGLNAGALWHTTDVKNKLKIGWGFMLGRSFLYNYGKPISLDVRARFLRGVWQGQDTKMTKLSPLDPGYNGTYGTYTNYLDSAGGKTYRNFQADVYDVSIELAAHINALREKTGIDFYIFGGIGLTSYQTLGNLYRGDTLVKTMYDYTQLQNGSQASIKSFLDDSFDTPLNGSSSKKHTINIMPSIGFGIGYQITPFIQIGLEHRTTFTRGDLFDGKDYDDNLNASKSKDLYHYTSLYLKINFKKKQYRKKFRNSSGSSTTNDSISSTYNSDTNANTNTSVVTPTCLVPQVNIVNPRTNFTTENSRFTVAALLNHVDTRAQILFKQNGQTNTNFTYNSNNNQFESNIVLVPGQNIIEMIATNSCGTSKEMRIITLKRTQLPPPIVTYINPPRTPYTTTNSRFVLDAKFLNIQQPSQVKMIFNGQQMNTFEFDFTNRELTANLMLNEGANTVTITATNTVGSDTKSVVIIYKKPYVTKPPVVQFVTPNSNPTSINATSYVITATVFNVEKSSNIFVHVNGAPISNFNFNKNTKILTFTASSLINGANIVTIKGVNEVGQDIASTTLIYQRVATKTPPIVQFITPGESPITSALSSYQVVALTRYVTSKQNIKVRINGIETNNFTYNPANQTVELQTSLLNGANVIYVQGTNQDGSDDATTTIIYRQPNLTQPPVVNITSPVENPAVSEELSVPLEATVLNVVNKNEIQLTVNGTTYNNFTFNSTTHELNFTAYFYSFSTIHVKITATNSAGTSSDTQTIKHLIRTVHQPPTLVITQPNQAGTTTQDNHYTFKATSSFVDTKNNVQLNFNGVSVAPSDFSFTNNHIEYSPILVEGNNIFVATVSNSVGTASKSTTIVYEKKEAPCEKPVLTWVNLLQNATTTNDSILTTKVQSQYVNSANELSFKLNGQFAGAVNYDPVTHIAKKTVQLSEGMNVIQMMARTRCGFKLITRTIRYEKPKAPCLIPSVSAMKPNILSIQTQSNQVDLYASTVNVTSKSEIIVKVNGVAVDFTFDAVTHVIYIAPTLQEGNNEVKIYVSNNCGSSVLTWKINRKVCEKPIFELTSDVVNNETTDNANFSVSGLVKNISSNPDITLKLNGNPTNFIFNETTGSFSANFVLRKGMNNIVMHLQNSCGSKVYTFKRNYKPAPTVVPPYVQITNPSKSPYTSLASSIAVKALVQNVSNADDIEVKVNGASVPFNFNGGFVTFHQNLINGNNTIVVSAANSAGSDADTKVVKYVKEMVVLPPIVAITSPKEVSTTTESSSFTVRGVVKNIANFTQIYIYVNGRQITKFNPKKSAGQIAFSFPLVFDNFHLKYEILVKSSNAAGSDTETRTISKKIPIINVIEDLVKPNKTDVEIEKPQPTRKPIVKPESGSRPVNETVRPTGRR